MLYLVLQDGSPIFQKEKGAQAGSEAGAKTEDDEEGARLAQSDVEGSDGQ